MFLVVKVLQGPECTVEAHPDDHVGLLKVQVASHLGIPVEHQRFVFKGRPLADDTAIGTYGFKDRDKIHLSIKKPALDIQRPTKQKTVLWDALRLFLAKHFMEKDAAKVLEVFRKDFENNIANLSLDDIERIASFKLDSRS